jgi:hypothetical protein
LPLFFFYFCGIAVASAVMVIAARNPVHSVLFLILAFVNAAGLFMLMGAEFLAMILVVVYVGAVAVLFLFVVMMLDVDFAELRAGLPAVPADRRADRADPAGSSCCWSAASVWAPERPTTQAACRSSRRRHQHRGARPGALHRLRLLLPARAWCCWSP